MTENNKDISAAKGTKCFSYCYFKIVVSFIHRKCLGKSIQATLAIKVSKKSVFTLSATWLIKCVNS